MHQIAVFLHLVHWDVPDRLIVPLSEDVRLCKSHGTNVYRHYANTEAARAQQGKDPFSWASHAIIDAQDSKWLYDFGGHRSAVSRLCNIVTVALGRPVGHATLMASDDGFATVSYIDKPHDQTFPQGDLIFHDQPTHLGIDPAKAALISRLWAGDCDLRDGQSGFAGNVASALDYFLYAWRSYYYDQLCLNLCISLEQLFSPSARTELSHRISFNASRFLGADPATRRQIYTTIKRYYDHRSAIVHAGKPKQKEIESLTPAVFGFCVEAFRRILPDAGLRRAFSNKEERDDKFGEWLFE